MATNFDVDCFVQSWRGHVQVLSRDIGPRGSTTPAERRAAEYCRSVLARLGYVPRLEGFRAARSIYRPHLVAACIFLVAFIIYPLAGHASAVIGAVLASAALASDLLELSLRDNPLRRLLPKGPSQNVIAVASPAEQHRRDVILMAHLDSHRTPLIFSSPGWLAAYRRFTTVAFVVFAAQALLYIMGAYTQHDWIWPATIPAALCAVALAALCIQADATPFSAGANDNASAVGLVLTLAQHLVASPLRHTRVWLVCTGCEETNHYGAVDFYRRHRTGMRNPEALVFEMLGCAGPSWLLSEGIVVPFHADRRMVALAGRLASEHPEWEAHATRIVGGNTEMADALTARVPAITFAGATPEGEWPYWHQAGDTYDKIDPEVLARSYDFTWAMIQALDGEEKS